MKQHDNPSQLTQLLLTGTGGEGRVPEEGWIWGTYFQDCVPKEGTPWDAYLSDFDIEAWDVFAFFWRPLPTELGPNAGAFALPYSDSWGCCAPFRHSLYHMCQKQKFWKDHPHVTLP